MARIRTTGSARRRAARQEFWPRETAWTGETEKGWFRAPRTLPLLLALMASKKVSGNTDPTRVYLELLARHLDEGVVQMAADEDHAFAAGYAGDRGVRSWRERIRLLEGAGIIKIRQMGSKRFAYVLLVHPSVFVPALRDAGKVDPEWWEAYRHRQLETGEVALAHPDDEFGAEIASWPGGSRP
jgi:hypothetical protein